MTTLSARPQAAGTVNVNLSWGSRITPAQPGVLLTFGKLSSGFSSAWAFLSTVRGPCCLAERRLVQDAITLPE